MQRGVWHFRSTSARCVVLAAGLGFGVVPLLAQAPAPPIEEWRTSPYHGAISGATGKPIPCLCRFHERAYQVGETVCMQTLYGFKVTRCDLAQNNTSWVPTPEPCASSAHPQSRRFAGHF